MRDPASDLVKAAAVTLRPESLVESIIEMVGDADIVSIGAATHGTHEFFRLRGDLTRALIESHGFNLVAIDADWPDVERLNRWVRLAAEDLSAVDALGGPEPFPRWVWKNADTVRFLEWLRQHNVHEPHAARVGVYSLDPYSLHRSMATLLQYLGRAAPAAAVRARERYGCIDVSGRDSQTYGYAAILGLSRAVEHDCVRRLVEACAAARPVAIGAPHVSAEGRFALDQHARALAEAETFYRAMFGSSTRWWNLRDAHMLVALEALLGHAVRTTGIGRAVVWAHNAHIGETSGSRQQDRGEVSFGRLARDRFGDRLRSVAFTTHVGSVTAAAGWAQPITTMALRASHRDSYEHLFHETGLACFAVDLHGPAAEVLRPPRLERAVGAVYRPDSERWSHYLEASLPQQFDLVVHCDETSAVEPLESWAQKAIDVPEPAPASVC